MLLNHWRKTFIDTELLNTWLPSIKQLVILNADYYQYQLVQPLLKPLVSVNNTLQHLHLVFERPTYWYPSILSELIHHHISVHTMILEVEKGHKFYPNDRMKDLHKMEPLYWPNTNQLTLSIQHSSELILLLKRGALPAIEHLNITNEEIRTALPLRQHISASNIHLCEYNLREIADGTRLRTLLLRYITLSDIIILIGSLTMPLLEKLILIDLYDHTLDHVDKFQKLCGSTHLPSLKKLHFSLCFPQEMKQAWQMRSFNYNGKWPFDNLVCYIDESWISTDGGTDFMTKTLFIVYTRPIYIILQHKRTLHNHRFATHAAVPIITTQRRSLEVTYDQTDEPEQLVKTLQVVASSRVDKFQLICLNKQVNPSMTSDYCSSCNLLLYSLRSMSFNFKSKSIKRSDRVSIVKQILNIIPNLSHLEIEWEDFRHCSQTYSNLKHVHLVLDRFYPEPKQHFNVRRLTQLAPHLHSLETSNANIMFHENLVEFVLKIIRQFHQLVHLILNKDSLYPSKEEIKTMFKEKLISTVLFEFKNRGIPSKMAM
ncbi:unnamed protein product, partial [Didymodactylos carnosus]